MCRKASRLPENTRRRRRTGGKWRMTVLDFQARYIKTTYLLVSLLIQSKRWHNCSCQIWLTWHSVCAVFGRNVRTTVGYCTPLKKPLQAVLFKVSAGPFCAELSTRLFTKQEPKEFIQRNMNVFINIPQQGCVPLAVSSPTNTIIAGGSSEVAFTVFAPR